MKLENMRVALVYDRVNKIGGAERVLSALHEIWPDAPLYTSVYNPPTTSWAKDFQVIPSFLQKFPLARTNHELYFWLTPLAFESFDLTQFDIVISVTSAEAKGIITQPGTLHICYCLTPTRYVWSGFLDYKVPFFARFLVSGLRLWDQIACFRPDIYLAISQTVAQRIKKYYRKDSLVIYPPVDTNKWRMKSKRQERGNYFLIVSRLVSYKRVDVAIKAFNHLELPLKIIGTGAEEKRLKRLARENIEFLGQLTDDEVLRYYQECQAVIFPQEEDFGLVPLESQACGSPVVAYRAGGALETIVEGQTGEFFYPQTSKALVCAIENFRRKKYSADLCRQQAGKFDINFFKEQFKEFTEKEWKKYLRNIFTS